MTQVATRPHYSLTVVVLPLLLAGACRNANRPDSVADGFVDAYYIELDLARAKTFTHGSALRRIETEERLVAVARSQIAIQDAKAHVYYETPERHDVDEDKVHFRYDLDIRRGATSMIRPTVVMVAKQNGHWRVIQFREDGQTARPDAGGRPEGVATSTRAPPL